MADYHGLPVTLASEEPEVVQSHFEDVSRGTYDVGRFGLLVGIADSDPFFLGVVIQYGKPIAAVHCLSGKQGLVKALREDDPEKLRRMFGIDTNE